MDIVDKCRAKRADPEAQRDGGEEPARANPLAGNITRNFKDNVADVEDG